MTTEPLPPTPEPVAGPLRRVWAVSWFRVALRFLVAATALATLAFLIQRFVPTRDRDTLIQQIINGLAQGAIYALIAVGYTMVYGVLRLINFAHGDVYMVGAMVGVYAADWMHIREPGWGAFLLVMLSSMLVCGVLGFLIEILAYRPLRNQPRLTALITAIGVSMFLEYGGQKVFGADPKAFPSLLPGDPILYQWSGVYVPRADALIFVVSFVLMVVLTLVVKYTQVGRALRAVSFRFDTAALMGVNVNRIISFTFVLGSVLAAAAGVLIAVRAPKVEPLMGLLPGLKAFVAAVLGGIGNIPGAVAGAFALGLIETFVVGYIPGGSQYRDGAAFVILIGVLLVRPTGLFGRGGAEKV
jgi:branched-chain amino acid transport system permease protein